MEPPGSAAAVGNNGDETKKMLILQRFGLFAFKRDETVGFVTVEFFFAL